MKNTSLQLTIRGLDSATKEALVKKANQRGLSLNRYALNTLRQEAGLSSSEQRYRVMKDFLEANHISSEDRRLIDQAVDDLDKMSLEKQSRDVTI